MKKFEFSPKNKPFPIFTGKFFYYQYKDSEFLTKNENIMNILSKGYEIRQSLNDSQPDEDGITLAGMYLKNKQPLFVKKTGSNVMIKNFEFTANRLAGFVAAYAYENRGRFPNLQSYEASKLGLTWNNNDEMICKLYLSAVTGAEHFYEQFCYWPLICAIRKLQLNKITIKPVIKIAKVKNPQGDTMAKVMMRNLNTVKIWWKYFPNTSTMELKSFLKSPPEELKLVFGK